MNKKINYRLIADILLVIAALLVSITWAAMTASGTHAAVDTGRPDACRTYNVSMAC